MGNTRVAAITEARSDMTEALSLTEGIELIIISPNDILNHDLDAFDALVILGGAQEQPLQFPAYERLKIEEQIAKGKKVFCEYCSSISSVYFLGPTSTRFLRMAYTGYGLPVPGLAKGALLEDQSNTYLPPFLTNPDAKPILAYKQSTSSHSRARLSDRELRDRSKWAMWFERDNLLLCMFRICNYNRARMAPLAQWRGLVSEILIWLCGGAGGVERLDPPYRCASWDAAAGFDEQVSACACRAVDWFERADMLADDGRRGVLEGLGTEVLPDGRQKRMTTIRSDCTGETSLLYYLHHMLTGDRRSLERADNLIAFCFGPLQIKGGPFHGMVRWTETAWETCYQDDVARVVLPWLLRCLYSGDRTYLGQCVDALNFLAATTGTDGTRVMRTDNASLSPEAMSALASVPGNLPSAHYNAFYLAALLLCGRLAGVESFESLGLKGLATIMATYPDTAREQSETEELCRLVMPLAFAYWATGAEEQWQWLYRVAEDLQRFRHPSGGYIEWDTGYTASCSRTKGGESSMLTKNGDPVVDMLYSLNWLPSGFMHAWFITGDRMFLDLWKDIAAFFARVQLSSADAEIDGAWTRGFDVNLMEVYGSPNDVGWGPWAVETGWTVAEIGSGLLMGVLRDRLAPCYRPK